MRSTLLTLASTLSHALLILLCASSVHGQLATTSQLLDVAGTPALTAPVVTLSWTAAADLTDVGGHTVLRRRRGEDAWMTLTTTLPANASGYADGTAELTIAYEYKVIRLHKNGTTLATGYLAGGADVPMTDDRGKLVLIVDQTMAAALPAEIAQLQQDLAGDGWQVVRHDVPRMAVNPANTSTNVYAARAAELAHVKSLIVDAYTADPANVRAVYLLGRVPVPYSGRIAPDGHSDHVGAWPADGYYGDMDGVWTDSSLDWTGQTGGIVDPGRMTNVPGDGKFDQSQFPGNGLELAVGRVDLSSMTKFPNAATTEADLLARYLRRAHAYRHGQIWGNGRTVARRACYINNMGSGWAAFAGRGVAIEWSLVGRSSTSHQGAWFGTGSAPSSTDYLLAYAVGGGGPESMMNVGTSADFGSQPSLAVFNGLFGSYFVDWDVPNNLLRAPLAGTPNSLGLASFWGGPQWFLYHMSLGETIGHSTRFSMNNTAEGYPTVFDSGGVHMALMGDPSLRLHVVLPPSNVRAQASGGSVSVTWEASPDSSVLGYHVYRGPTELGPFTRLTGGAINALSFTDTGAPEGQSYMVRALKRERGLGGRYHNLSQGAFTRAAPTSSAVTYHANGSESGEAPEAQTKIQGEALTLAANSGNLARAGYTFVGWNTKADGSGTDYAAGASYTADGAVTLYARWTSQTTYAVSYLANGADSGTTPAAQKKIGNVLLTLASNSGSLIRDGYAFAGWNTAANGTGVNYDPGSSFNGGHGLTLYARWTPLTYIVTYDANGATSGTAPAQVKTHGTALTLHTTANDLRKAGYTLAGWNTQADGSGTQWDTGASYTANAEITLYAQWTVSDSIQTLTATAGPNGSISPSGTVILNTGESQFFSITPAPGYEIADVLVDGVSVGAVASYTFPAVTANHTIAASFDIAPVVALAWGHNQYGKLGDGTIVNRGSPVNVLLDGQPMANVVGFASSFSHSVALRGDGRVLTWGRNHYGQLGDGTTTDRIAPALLDGLTGVTAVSADHMDFTAALKADGTVWMWGRGDRGELGDGTDGDGHTSTVPVQADITNVTAIATGQGFTAALKGDGTVWAWGYNQSGQLGNGTTVNTNRPVQIPGLSDIVAIAASANHGAALKDDGTVWIWGNGGGAPAPYTPVQVEGLAEVTAIAVGGYHVLALKADRTVWAWGYWNMNGQLGDGTLPPSRVRCYDPRPTLISDVVAIAAGSDHSLAIKADGSAWAWGSDAYGQIGVGRTVWNSSNVEPTPVQVLGSRHYFAIFAGFRSSFALMQPRNTLLVTYNANGASSGTVPLSQTKTPDEPLTLSANTGDLRKAGYTFEGWNTAANGGGADYAEGATYTANETVTLYARWTVSASIQTITASAGANGSISPAGAVILNTGESQSFTITPDIGYKVADLRVDGVSVGAVTSYTFATVTTERTIAASFDTAPALAWGFNENGQLADGTKVNRGTPVNVLLDGRPMTDAVAFSSSFSHTLALRDDGRVLTWGQNNYGQLGDGSTTDRAAPALVDGLTGVTAVSAHSDFTAALKDDGTVWVWGRGDYGQLGNGTDGAGNQSEVPVQADIAGVAAIATGQGFTAALKDDGTVWAWGLNASYQLGNGTTVNANRPVQIPGLSGIDAIAAGNFGVALKNDGTVWVWGWGGGAYAPYTPVQVAGLSNVTAIAAGDDHVLALKADGTVWAWGYHNFYGQFGDGTTSWSVNLYTPRRALISDVVAIAAGIYHSLAIKADGSAWAWGSDWTGQTGGGWPSADTVPTPMQTLGDLHCIAIFAGGYSSFALQQSQFTGDIYTITAAAGANGTISPSGAVTVSHGANQSFTITPAGGYQIADVLVDGVSVGAVASYTFTNVTTNHTLAASFEAAPPALYALTVNSGSGGGSYEAGIVVSIVADAPSAGQAFDAWTGDTAGVADASAASTTLTMPAAAATVTATYRAITYTITAAAGANGAISPSGAVTVSHGANQSFTITPTGGYQVADVLVDGVSVGAVTSYTFTNVTTNHTLAASFEAAPPALYALTVNSGSGGGSYEAGTVVSIVADAPSAGQAFDAWIGDTAGVADASAASTTLTMPAATVTVTATYRAITYTITAAAGANGTISPSGAVTVSHGANQSFTITPAGGYQVTDVLVDGVSVGAVASYTFSTVTADHTLAASFDAVPNLAVPPCQEHWEDFAPGASPVGQDGWEAAAPEAAVVETASYSYAHARPPLDPAPDRTNQVLRLSGEAGVVSQRLAPAPHAERFVWDAMVALNVMTDEQACDALLGDDELKTGFYVNPEGRLTLLHQDATVATNRLTALADGYDALADGAWARVTVAFDFASDPEGGSFFRVGLHGVFLSHPLGLTEPDRQAGQAGGTWFLCPNQAATGLSAVEFAGSSQLDDYRIGANLATLPYQEHWEELAPGVSPVGEDGWYAASPGAAVVEALSYSYAHARPPLDPAPEQTNQVLSLTGEAGAVQHRLAPAPYAGRLVWDALLALNAMPDEQGAGMLFAAEARMTGFYVNPAGRLTLLHRDAASATNRLTVLDNGYDALANGAWARVTLAFDFASDPEGGRFFRVGLHGVFLTHPLGLTEPDQQSGQSGGAWFLCPNQEGAGVAVVEFLGSAKLDDYRVTTEVVSGFDPQALQAFDDFSDSISFVIISGVPDVNRNGVDDRWEMQHWPDGTPPATVTKRGREMPLHDVFVADLNPFDEDSVLEITRFGRVWKDGAWQAELDFGPASTRRLYDLEASPHATGGWQRVRGDIAPEGSSVRIETPATEESQRFYRIQVRLPPPEE